MDVMRPDTKLLVIDIDGTLLNPLKEITPRTLAAVQAAQQAGIIVTLATARRYWNTWPIAAELGIDSPLILCDGALIIHHPQGTVLHTQTLPAETAQQAFDIMVRYGIQPIVHRINGSIEETWTGPSEFDNEWVAAYFSLLPEHIYRHPYDSCCAGQQDPLRVVAFASEEVVNALIPEVSQLSCSWSMTRRGNYGTAELAVMHTQCSKARGVMQLASSLDIAMEQVMAIGDNTNDVAMLQAVGWGIAMGQAPESVKNVAHAITASNAEDGVAQAIERYLLPRARNAASNSLKRVNCR